MMFLIQWTHCGWCWWNDIVNKEEQCIFCTQMNSLSDQEIKLSYSQVRRNQVFLFVQIANPCFRCLFNNNLINQIEKIFINRQFKLIVKLDVIKTWTYRNSVRIFLAYFFTFSSSLFKWMFFFVWKLHF